MNNDVVFDPKGNQAMPTGPQMDSFLKWLWERPLVAQSGGSPACRSILLAGSRSLVCRTGVLIDNVQA
jgi:hypothetical protein